jgi:DNA (cytosine-5)-methyltransferase 1
MFTFIDLFCGIGGFHRAMSSLGGRCVLACDIDPTCRENYALNFGMTPESDIRKLVDIPDHDILCAGFPCQPFSNAGHKAAFSDQVRGTLFYEIVRILDLKKPAGFVLENVKHILKIQNGEVFQIILQTLQSIGYSVQVVVLSPDAFGVPQNRERVYFLGRRGHAPFPDYPDIEEVSVSVLEVNPPLSYRVKPDVEAVINAWNEALPILAAADFHHPVILDYFRTTEDSSSYAKWKQDYISHNKSLYSKNPEFWDAWMTKHTELLAKRDIYRKLEWQVGEYDTSIWNHFIQLRQSGIRVKKGTRFPTLVAMVQTPIYGPGRRYLTPRECARLQSFPDSHRLAEKDQVAYKHLGNSVNVNVVEYVGRVLLSWIRTNAI